MTRRARTVLAGAIVALLVVVGGFASVRYAQGGKARERARHNEALTECVTSVPVEVWSASADDPISWCLWYGSGDSWRDSAELPDQPPGLCGFHDGTFYDCTPQEGDTP